jgi:FkbM family methyltransferase
LLDAVTGGRGYLRTVNQSESFYVNPRARHLFPEVYEPEVYAFLRHHVASASTCFNVGAHVGVYTLALARWVGPRGHVVAFEPNPTTADLLEDHVTRNNLNDRVTVVRMAIGATPGTEPFAASGLEGFSRLGVANPARPPGTDPKTILVPVTTIDIYCRETGVWPNWIVMDIEGYEFAALAGARNTIARQGSRLQIVAEFHPALWPASGWDSSRGRELVSQLGLRWTTLRGTADPWTEHSVVHLAPPSHQPGAPA